MTWIDLLGVLGLLLTLALLIGWGVRAALQLGRGRRDQALRSARRAAWLLAGYALLLAGVALASPRRYRAPGEAQCFDDWCVAAVMARPAAGAPGCAQASGVWLVTLQVSSRARRVRQRAADATASLEDASGGRHAPCGPPLASGGSTRTLRDRLDPGQAIAVTLPFALPAGVRPAGTVVHHGAFPGALIIGDDQAALHPPTLLRLRLDDSAPAHG